MKLTILTIGKARKSPEAELWADWLKRCPFPAKLQEFDSRLPPGPSQNRRGKPQDAELCSAGSGLSKKLIGLDPNGVNIRSEDLSDIIGDGGQMASRTVFFAVGGADGHHQNLLDACDKLISFGRVTWPHMLCRAMLAEQLYRAEMILARHPYHRA